MSKIEIVKELYDANNRCVYRELSTGFWERYEYDDHGNLTYIEDSVSSWCKREYDNKGKIIRCEWNDGSWAKYEYDDRGKQTYYEYEDNTGYWVKKKYNNQGNEIYFENSNGEKSETPRAKYILDGKEYTADELRTGYRTITGLDNDTELTDNEIYSYLLEEFEREPDICDD